MNVALIPARGGSKRIKNKNIKKFCGQPLIYWICKSVKESIIDIGYLSTDSEKIKNIVNEFGFKKIKIIDRSKEASTDHAKASDVVKDFLNKIEYKFINFVYLNPTSPFFTYQYIDEALNKFVQSGKSSQVCVTKEKRLHWYKNGYPIDYNIFNRPRTQDLTGNLIEVGACYIQTYDNLMKYKNILGDTINVIELPFYFYHELDELLDWHIMTMINKKLGLLK